VSNLDLLGPGKESPLHTHFPALIEALSWAAAAIGLLAILVILIGALRFTVDFARAEPSGAARIGRIDGARMELGRYILAGLELFIVADIVETALSRHLSDLIFLGVLVAIRSVISFFLGREIAALRNDAPDSGAPRT
jgi:uncharacterized membrane protein